GNGAHGTLSGGAGDDLISSNGPSDTITGGSGNDTIILNHLPVGTIPTISGGGDGNDVLAITGTSGPDSVHVFKPAGADAELDTLNGLTATGTVKATGIHELDVNLDGGADTATIDNLQGSSTVLVNIDAGASDHRADAITIDGGSGNDTF